MEGVKSDLYGKVETDVEIKSSAEKFHNMFRHTPHDLPNIPSDTVHDCELLHGEWGTEGSIINWTYVHDGEKKTAKELIEAVDEENNSITFKVLEGSDLLKEYSSFRITLKTRPKDDDTEGSIVHWIFEYERHHDDIDHPESLIVLAKELSVDLDNHLCET